MRRLLAAAVLCTAPALAIVTVDDPANHVVNPGSVFDGVGMLFGIGNCSGTLLSTGIHVLTAAHCVTNSGTTTPIAAGSITVRFDLIGGPQTYTGTSLFVNPNFSPIGQPGYTGDLAIVQLNQVVDPLAQRYDLHTGSALGVAHLVGYGRQGTGNTGSVPGTSGVTKRSGQNEIEGVDSSATLLLFDFDNGLAANSVFGSLGLGNDEVMSAPGDSGGPAFIFSAGAYRIAGVNVVSGCPTFTSIDIDGSCSAQSNPGPNSTFGELGGATRLSLYQDWIQSVVDIPEPSTLTLIGLGLFITALKTRSARH